MLHSRVSLVAVFLCAIALVACSAPTSRRSAGSPVLSGPGGDNGGEGEGKGGDIEGGGEAGGEGDGGAEGEGTDGADEEPPNEGGDEGGSDLQPGDEGEGGFESGEGEGGEAEGGVDPDCVPEPELCNGRDDDCDGEVDEDDPKLGNGCDTRLPGPCWQGRNRCEEGELICRAVVEAAEEICDGIDNDCNGDIDDGDPGVGVECVADRVLGICRDGLTICVNGFIQCQDAPAVEELCDALDNNCNGEVDEGAPGDGEPCETGLLGVCAAGIGDCTEGEFTCVQQVESSDEECDGLDNDCDGEVDDGSPGDGEECDTGQDGVCAPGIGRCERGVFTCARNVAPSPELCDGLDNDCDGNVDEGPPQHGQPCELEAPDGCAFGRTRCEEGVVHCDEFEPSAEECDGLDNDCDGEVDEDDGQGECVRPNVMLCGRSSRNVTTFFPADSDFELVDGCAPDDEVQALLITRGGIGQVNGAQLQTYIRAGGIVITEYNIADDVWSGVFARVQQGGRNGSCRDNIATVFQFSQGDPFWDGFEFQEIAAGNTGCGHDVSNFPEIVPLAGWTAQAVCLGYRRLGAGRLWALDIDWQDRDNGQTQYSRDMIGRMILMR